LKDDPELYVRRSVANNLNDIGKDHPSLLVETARAWMRDADEERRWLIRHALRSALKRTEIGALETLGFANPASVEIRDPRVTPGRVAIGDSVVVAFELLNVSPEGQRVLVACRVHFVKARGETRLKVFSMGTVELEARAAVAMSKTISLAMMTTRKHYPGTHRVEVLLNGRPAPLGEFEVVAP